MRYLPLLLLAPLAACGDPAPAPTNTVTESGYIARVAALSPKEREGVLFRAIQSGGGERQCHAITQVEDLPATKTGLPTWRITCTGGAQWAVVLADDGTATVTGARDD